MMRRYDDIVQVRCARPDVASVTEITAAGLRDDEIAGIDVTEDEGVPQAFVWRGRLYVVRRVLDRWVERTPWWRSVLDPRRPADVTAREDDACGPVEVAAGGARVAGLAVADLEDPVWRLEASAGRNAPVGVYDLAGRVDGSWRLLRVGD